MNLPSVCGTPALFKILNNVLQLTLLKVFPKCTKAIEFVLAFASHFPSICLNAKIVSLVPIHFLKQIWSLVIRPSILTSVLPKMIRATILMHVTPHPNVL